MGCRNFHKVHKNTGEKIFSNDLSVDDCFVKTIILLTLTMTTCHLFPDARALALNREIMKRNFA